jgi:catechol 2,3-dioxygenase-like lactoylglutathione lyase family enzyme
MAGVSPRIHQVVLDSTDPRRSAEFWRRLVGLVYQPGHEPPESGEDDPAGRHWLVLCLPHGSALLAFQRVDGLRPSTWPDDGVPQQLHLDLTVGDRQELDAVHRKVLELGGALRLDRSDAEQEPTRVYADPDGHPFCVSAVDT